MTSRRTIRLAVLISDRPPKSVLEMYGDYDQIYVTWLREALSTFADPPDVGGVDLQVDAYHIFENSWPDLDRLKPPSHSSSPNADKAQDTYDGIILTGAPYSANDATPPFIPQLISFLRTIQADSAYSALKIFGFCFGHQVISVASGGEVVPGLKGSELGVYESQASAAGSAFFGTGESGMDVVCLQQLHEEHVPSPPPGFTTLLSTESYPVQAMARLDARPQILSIQGHPEYTSDMMLKFLDERTQYMHYSDDIMREAQGRIVDPAGEEGRKVVGWAILRMLLNLEGTRPS